MGVGVFACVCLGGCACACVFVSIALRDLPRNKAFVTQRINYKVGKNHNCEINIYH